MLDIDGAGRSRSLACLPTARGSTHERPGTWSRGPETQDRGVSGPNFKDCGPPNPSGASGASGGLQGPSGRGLPPDIFRVQELSRPPAQVGGVSGASKVFQNPPSTPSKGQKSGRASSPTTTASPSLSSNRKVARPPHNFFSLSEISAYTNEKVLLLTKMDLTEFRS